MTYTAEKAWNKEKQKWENPHVKMVPIPDNKEIAWYGEKTITKDGPGDEDYEMCKRMLLNEVAQGLLKCGAIEVISKTNTEDPHGPHGLGMKICVLQPVEEHEKENGHE